MLLTLKVEKMAWNHSILKPKIPACSRLKLNYATRKLDQFENGMDSKAFLKKK